MCSSAKLLPHVYVDNGTNVSQITCNVDFYGDFSFEEEPYCQCTEKTCQEEGDEDGDADNLPDEIGKKS